MGAHTVSRSLHAPSWDASLRIHQMVQVFLSWWGKCTLHCRNVIFPLQEMLDIMKAIYDMMGKCTYPVLKEDAPRQHVETFFQVGHITQKLKRLLSEQIKIFIVITYPSNSVILSILCGSIPSLPDLLITPCFFNKNSLHIVHLL